MSFGPPINKKGTMNIVAGTKWSGLIELNRMAFDDKLPKNSESRSIMVAIRLIKRANPHIEWIISFADATQCGDGAIYRACGFKLVGINKNMALRINPADNQPMHIIQAHHKMISGKVFRSWQAISGYMLKYIYPLDDSVLGRLTVPIIPYTKIQELGIGMYKGLPMRR